MRTLSAARGVRGSRVSGRGSGRTSRRRTRYRMRSRRHARHRDESIVGVASHSIADGPSVPCRTAPSLPRSTRSRDDAHRERVTGRRRACAQASTQLAIRARGGRSGPRISLTECAGDGPRFDAAAHIHLDREHYGSANCRCGARAGCRPSPAASPAPTSPATATPRAASRARKPCSGENSTCSACGAVHFILRDTSFEGEGVRSMPDTRELRQRCR